jgi:DNA-binding NarL/FixJ family response regulator
VLGVTEEVQRVADALNAVEAIPDREARVLAQSQVLADQAERTAQWRAERDRLIVELRAEGVSFRKIAARVGVSLGTVQDVLRGHSGPWGNRPRDGETTDAADSGG